MSDYPLDLNLIQIAVRVGTVCAITSGIAVGPRSLISGFLLLRRGKRAADVELMAQATG
jgi:hypothetical protein